MLRAPKHLPTLADQRGAQPKPTRLDGLKDVVAERRERTRRAQTFRNTVWKRDGSRCQVCQKPVKRTLERIPEQGCVHHRRGRNVAPRDRYNAAAAILTCAICHHGLHSGEIKL